MATVTNIQKITKAMKMVAAAKLRHAEAAMNKVRPIGARAGSVFACLDAGEGEEAPAAEGKTTYLAVTGDKGLCGGVNSSIVKWIKTKVATDNLSASDTVVSVVGDKGRAGLVRPCADLLDVQVLETAKAPHSFLMASQIASEVLADGSDKYVLVYNKFRSAVAYDTLALEMPSKANIENNSEKLEVYEFEGDQEAMLEDLYEFGLGVNLFSCLLEGNTTEQSQRMSAMENASSNASEMIEKLGLAFNRGRQAKITTELTEIVSGAESLKD